MSIQTTTRTVSSKLTKHRELTQKLKDLASSLEPGQLFPSQVELMHQYGVSDSTVLRSLEDLRRDGWIVRRHGVGTFVADPSQRPHTPRHDTLGMNTIAALSPYVLSYYKHCVDVLTVQVEAAGLSLVCHNTQNPSNFEAAVPLEALNPRGFILFSYSLEPVAKQLLARGHRVVIVGAPPSDVLPTVPTVYGDHEYGGYQATRYLISLGHRRIAYGHSDIIHVYNESAHYSIDIDAPKPLQRRLRWKGHERALQEARGRGLSIDDTVIGPAMLAAWEADPSLASEYLRRPNAPTCIIVWNDTEALSLMHTLHYAKVRVPDDVSIIGYDALPEGRTALPALTTVDQQVEQQLRAAVDLLSRETPPPLTQSVMVVPSLAIRGTCAPPRE